MDTLRWILLLLGIAILLGIYLSGRMNTPRRPRVRNDDDLDAQDLDHIHIRAEDSSVAPDIRSSDPIRAAAVEPIIATAPPDPRIRAAADAREVAQVPERAPREGRAAAEVAKNQDSVKVEIIRAHDEEADPIAPGGGEDRKPAWSWLKMPGRSAVPRSTAAAQAAREASPAPSVPQQTLPEKIIILHVAAPPRQSFLGVQLETALREQGLEFGDMSIYHCHVERNGHRTTLFSVANMVKPGTFEPSEMKTFSSPGLSLFLRLPGPMDPLESFETMLSCADNLAKRLGGQVLDASRSAMTRQCREHAREEIGQWRLRAGPGGR